MKALEADQRITWTVAYVHRFLAEPLAVAHLAQQVNLSPSRFRQLFTAQVGVAPSQYVQQLRLRRARLLLENTFLSVKEVMALVGYNDPSHFSRDFRRLHGTTPTAVRGSSLDPLTHRRIRQSRARDPGAFSAYRESA